MYEIYCKLRDEMGLKDADVVRATGITKSTFSSWKSGKYTPKDAKLKKIADFFNVSVEYLRTGKEPSSDFLYSDENADFLIEVQRKAHNLDFVKRMTMYMGLSDAERKSVDDMIEFLYNKEKNEEAD